MRSIIIMALLMPAMASAHLKPTDTQQLGSESQQQTAAINATSRQKKTGTDMSTVRAQTPAPKPSTQAKTKPPAKSKKANSNKTKTRSQGMNFLTFMLMLKDGKQ